MMKIKRPTAKKGKTELGDYIRSCYRRNAVNMRFHLMWLGWIALIPFGIVVHLWHAVLWCQNPGWFSMWWSWRPTEDTW